MLGRIIRKLLEKRGYLLIKKRYVRFGFSPFVDIQRLNEVWGRNVAVLFDVGANAGQFAVEANTELPDTKILSFEPHPGTFKRLVQNVQREQMIVPVQLAFSDFEGEAVMYEYGAEGDGSLINSLIADARFPTKFGFEPREIGVPASTIDSYCEENDIHRIDFLKLDVEGSELSVLHGAKRMFSEQRIDAVYFEFNDLNESPNVSGGALMPVANWLESQGLQYACVYTDYLLNEQRFHACANALFVRAPLEPS